MKSRRLLKVSTLKHYPSPSQEVQPTRVKKKLRKNLKFLEKRPESRLIKETSNLLRSTISKHYKLTESYLSGQLTKDIGSISYTNSMELERPHVSFQKKKINFLRFFFDFFF